MFDTVLVAKLRGVASYVKEVASEALALVRAVTERDVCVVTRQPTKLEDAAARGRARVEHSAWHAELLRSRDERRAAVACLERHIDRKTKKIEAAVRRAEGLLLRRESETLRSSIAASRSLLIKLEANDTPEQRRLFREANQVATQDRALDEAATRLETRLRTAADPERFVDRDATLRRLANLVSLCPNLDTLSIDSSKASCFLLEEADRIAVAVSRAAPALATVSLRALSRHGAGLTDAALLPRDSFNNLRLFSIKSCHCVTDVGVLAVISRCPNLEVLDCEFCVGVSDTSLFGIATAPCKASLTSININRAYAGMTPNTRADYGPACTDAGIVALATACANLQDLRLRGYRATHPALRPPLSATTLTSLLRASSLTFVDAAATHFADENTRALWTKLDAQLAERSGMAIPPVFDPLAF